VLTFALVVEEFFFFYLNIQPTVPSPGYKIIFALGVAYYKQHFQQASKLITRPSYFTVFYRIRQYQKQIETIVDSPTGELLYTGMD